MSLKRHLHRALGNNKITLEDFKTVIIRIEGVLNSRRLFPLAEGVNESQVLTPGYFLIAVPSAQFQKPTS